MTTTDISQAELGRSNPSADDLIPEEDRRRILIEWNDTYADFPKDKGLHAIFESHADHMPGATALVLGEERLTYGQLNEKANQLAHYLHKLGASPNSPVGILLDRSFDTVIAMLAVLKAGSPYVPFDLTYPKAHLAEMFRELNLDVLLTKQSLLHRLPQYPTRIIALDAERESILRESPEGLANRADSANLAYIVFTSGSTGKPRAAAVHHGGWTNLLNWFVNHFQITARDKGLLISSFGFDLTQRSIMMPLVSGGELHLLASNYYDAELISDTIDRHHITILNCAPSALYPLVDNQYESRHRRMRSLRLVYLGGEPISASRLQKWAASPHCNAEFVNVYGVAECSDVSTFYRLRDFPRYAQSSVPIGKPIFNTRVYVVDADLTPVPIGVIGELCVAGEGVGRGYLNDPVLTNRKFVPDPFSSNPSATIYRTGDLVRYLPDGNLEFVGRMDHEVKIRGMRVDLGEIETAIRQHPGVLEAVAVMTKPTADDQVLTAYVVPVARSESDATSDVAPSRLIDELRRLLGQQLPRHMLPNNFSIIPEVPLNPNGKIDRAALLDVTDSKPVTVSDGAHTGLEIAIGAFFAEVLGVGKVGFDEDFFDLGGHSLMAAKVLNRIYESFGVHLDLAAFAEEKTTVVSLARQVQQLTKRGPDGN